MDKNKLILSVSILLGCLILGGSYYFVQLNKQNSIENQQREERIEKSLLESRKTDQEQKEYIVKRKKDCYELLQTETKKWNNTNDSFYNEEKDVCVVTYKTDEYKGKNCSEEYKDIPQLFINCVDGTFSKEF